MNSSSEEIRGRIEDVEDFRAAFDSFVSAHHHLPDEIMGGGYWVPNEGVTNEEIGRLRAAVSRSAGRATAATKGKIVLVYGVPANLIQNWARAFTEEGQMTGVTVTTVRDFVDSALGELESLLRRAERRRTEGASSARPVPPAVKNGRLRRIWREHGPALVIGVVVTVIGGLILAAILAAVL